MLIYYTLVRISLPPSLPIYCYENPCYYYSSNYFSYEYDRTHQVHNPRSLAYFLLFLIMLLIAVRGIL